MRDYKAATLITNCPSGGTRRLEQQGTSAKKHAGTRKRKPIFERNIFESPFWCAALIEVEF